MKKIVTLIGTVLLVTASFAQYDSDNRQNQNGRRDAVYSDNWHRDHRDRRDDIYRNNFRERDMEIAEINREYDRRISSVKHRWFMGHSRKEAIICSLEDKRRYEIKRVYERFSGRDRRFDDDYSKDHW